MDPFTEKLLERTRARRENLQKKMAERPNSSNRQVVKRAREPLGESNSAIIDPVSEKVPQMTIQPSISKRRCSEENLQLAPNEENKEPNMAQEVPILFDPPTNKKPPVGPSTMEPFKVAQPGVENLPDSVRAKNKEALAEDSVPFPTNMKSRLQRLAEQRKCWDGTSNAAQECTPLQLSKRHDVPPVASNTVSSGTPLGRKGRLANLAATIGSWEDDLSHVHIPKECPKQKESGLSTSTLPVKNDVTLITQSAAVTRSDASSKSASSTHQVEPMSSLQSSTPVDVLNPEKVGMSLCKPAPRSAPNHAKNSSHGSTLMTTQENAIFASSSHPQSSSKAVSQSPLKNQVLSREADVMSSPKKPEPRVKAMIIGPSASQQEAKSGVPGVKSFLERFEERCQERANQCTPGRIGTQAKFPVGTQSVTPNTRLLQEKLTATKTSNTSTAELTYRQKQERESELAQIRGRFQKGNRLQENVVGKAQMKMDTNTIEEKDLPHSRMEAEGLHKPVGKEVPCKSQDEAVSKEITKTFTKSDSAGEGLMSPPALTSSPLRASAHNERISEETFQAMVKGQEAVTETETNSEQSINSAVINEIFEEVLEQSEDQSEEEDALNISSMSLLTPLAETVAAVVNSPLKEVMTSTPTNSFIVTNTENCSEPGMFQRATVTPASSVGADASDSDHKLMYSIDAYRSTRVKESGRPNAKQVIERKEDVLSNAEESRGPSHFSINQNMKILSNKISLQQTVIHQASQALNCCTDEEHGKGSQVEAEAERLLLVATEQREALRSELELLKGSLAGHKKALATPETACVAASKGSITLQEMRLPLKAEFVCSIANRPDSTKHSFFIMIRAGAEHTVATPLASTHRGLSGDTLTFPTKFTMSDVSSDFEIHLEIYCLVQRCEMSSDKKKKTSKSKAITPKRFLAITKSSQTPVVSSPGGPNAVRTSHFVLVGTRRLSLSSIGKTKFPLEKVPFLCPLEGHIFLKVRCEVGSKVEEKGFLTMFEDVSGFGAWHRRWCVLSGYCISYWTYPDDEKRKNPIGRINLATCTSTAVEPANREFCARPNTFELITARPQTENDKETLVSQCKNTMCVTTNWLSADTKPERNLWMRKLNQILMDLRMWQPDAC